MSSWRVARSLLTLRAQYDTAHPGRSRVHDGTIGDARHAATKSDHNPGPDGVVQAIDLTAEGAVGRALADAAIATLKARGQKGYVIHQGKIANPSIQGGAWRTYRGSNPHNHHVHVSVHTQIDTTAPWRLGVKGIPSPVKPPTAAVPRPRKLTVDGIFGPATEAVLARAAGLQTFTSRKAFWRAVQRWARMSEGHVDGVLGPRTAHAIARRIGADKAGHTAWNRTLIARLQAWLNEWLDENGDVR